ncbi:Acyl-ACP thioesterase [Roseimaritima multifibrata]|uniref:Acyl-ACP thioesterase n=1 Tax=Roseimaritima multifibrata TaxID=1930274 RepID=A0A517MJ91_9BACT|nr:acyl-CoA thioesterase [Roseimaritima multifibrata]QDS94928.1 Acyl-ACP thioesterase [Roseimaritima multifibrata]
MDVPHVSAVFDFEYVVQADEIDAQDHVHNLRYLQWSLWAAHRHTAAGGWDSRAQLDENGIGWVVRSHEITYRAAAFAEDQLIVRTWVSEVSHVSCERKFLICRPADRTILCRGATRWAFVNLRIRKAVAIPQSLLDAAQPLTKSPGPPW